MYDFLIVGSGLFGSVFAQQARRKGRKVLMIEKREHTGGNCYCKKMEGINVHYYGPHIFHTDSKEIWDYVNQFVSFNNFINSPLANYRGEIYNLPFNMNTFNRLWGVVTPEEARRKLKEQREKLMVKTPRNLEEQAVLLVGVDIYERLIKGYTEKQWGRSCRSLPGFIIKRLPVRFRYDNNYYDDQFQGIPISGYNELFKSLLEGVEVKINEDFFKQRSEYEKIAAKILYTGSLDRFYEYQFGALEYRSLSFDHQVLNESSYQGNAVVNFTAREVPYTRIIEHKYFEFLESKNTVITREYPEEWKKGSEAYYPINNDLNNELFKRYEGLSKMESRVIFGGRLADYRYYNMDQVIARALLLAKKVI
jgi:UDP-galactopyranose mutase